MDHQDIETRRKIAIKNLRRSLWIFGVTTVIVVVAQVLTSISLWLPFVIIGVLSLTMIGDLVTYLQCRGQLNRSKNKEAVR